MGEQPGGTLRQLRVLDRAAAIQPAPRSRPSLVERTAELEAIRSAIDRASAGSGSTVVLAAGAGLGKTALLDYAANMAADARLVVRRAAPAPHDGGLAFGVVRSLLEGHLRDASERERSELLAGAAAPAGALLQARAAVPAGAASAPRPIGFA